MVTAAVTERDVFLSHNSTDKGLVETLAAKLEDEAGLSVWLATWHLIPGEPWQEGIQEALDRCKTYAIFIGASGLGPWHHQEMQVALSKRALDRGRRVIPVLLPGADPISDHGQPAFLANLTWVDYRAGIQDVLAFDRLIKGIKGVPPGRPPTSSNDINKEMLDLHILYRSGSRAMQEKAWRTAHSSFSKICHVSPGYLDALHRKEICAKWIRVEALINSDDIDGAIAILASFAEDDPTIVDAKYLHVTLTDIHDGSQ